MKKLQLFLLILISCFNAYSQNVGIGTTTPNNNALLEISSSTKGILIPRTSTSTRVTIPAVKGLLLYDTTTNSFWYNDGVNWMENLSGNNGWGLNGNSNTNPSVNFIGTTDNQPIRFRQNNQWAGSIDSAFMNTSIGYGAAKSITTGFSNTAFGGKALNKVTSGYFNTAFGAGALTNITTSHNNTAIGLNALFSNGFGSENTAIGSTSLYNNITGIDNTVIGYSAMLANTGGSSNTATGVYALYHNTNGHSNSAYGVQSLFSNTTGQGNTAVGINSL